MFNTYSTALSALSADSTAIDITGNNLANLNTPGYKASEVQFHDLMATTMGGGTGAAQIGMGVGPAGSYRNFMQGTITNTGNPTDTAIQGDGFYVVQNSSGQQLYTRAGNFQFDDSGNLLTATGENVEGWNAVNGVVNPSGAIGNISIPVGGVMAATPTTTMSFSMNLNSEAGTTGTGSTFSAPIQVIDSQGSTHTLTATFTKTGTNKWGYSIAIPSADLSAASSTPLATGTLTFDGSGQISSPAATTDPTTGVVTPPSIDVKIAGLADGASDMDITWNLADATGKSSITQLAQASAVSGTDQNGVAAGTISKVSIENGGLVVAQYSNGKQAVVAQLAMASIRNPQSLLAVGNNELAATPDTAPAVIGAAGTGGRGQIVAGSLEASTVDIATEFTNLLTYERGYQAASRVITTTDQLTQETVNLIHP
jgi:flagellar hook protein FlgE